MLIRILFPHSLADEIRLAAVPGHQLLQIKDAGQTSFQNAFKHQEVSMDKYDRSLAPRFAELLRQREADLRDLLRATGDVADHQSDVSEGEVVDFKDMAVEETRAVVEEAKAGHAVEELEQVVAARRRIADGSYGECLDCGEDIDLRRLNALPASPYCTACQAIHEQESSHARRRAASSFMWEVQSGVRTKDDFR
jgi:DnaK suppressor protein